MIGMLVSTLYVLIAVSLAATVVLGLIYLMMSLRFGSAIDHAESHQTLPQIGVTYYATRVDVLRRNSVYAGLCLMAMLGVAILVHAVLVREAAAAFCGVGAVSFLTRAIRGFIREADDYHRMTSYTVREASDEVLGVIPQLQERR